MQLSRIHELLAQEGVAVGCTTLRRYVRQVGLWKPAKTTVRMAQWPQGEVAELDFGRLRALVDETTGKKQVVWALVVVLPYSRHQFVWPLLRQTLEESIEGLEMAWRFFGGVPKRLILDNFSAAIAGPDALEPRPTRGFLEYSQERGFFIDAARVRRPRDKPHVERSIQYVRERFFKGGGSRDLEDCREQAERWCRDVAGLRVHGTTRELPREVFEAEERAALQPYDGVIYDVPQWKEVTVHPDHHVSFGQALYSLPATNCPPGTKLEVRGDRGLEKLYKKGELVKVHPRQPRGGRATDADDYPQEKTAYALRAPDCIVRKATEFGPNVETFATKLVEGPRRHAAGIRAAHRFRPRARQASSLARQPTSSINDGTLALRLKYAGLGATNPANAASPRWVPFVNARLLFHRATCLRDRLPIESDSIKRLVD